MRSDRARNFRRRGGDDDDNTEDSVSGKHFSTAPSSSSLTNVKPRKSVSEKPKKLLSFADDEEEEEGALVSLSKRKTKEKEKSSSRFNKSNASGHKITSAKDRASVTSSSGVSSLLSNVQPQAGMYTKEVLLELQKNTRTLAAPSRSQPVASAAVEPKVILKGLLKPQQLVNDVVKGAKELDSDEEKKPKREDGARGGGEGSEFYPDKAAIDAARAKRERMRQRGSLAPEYISLDGGTDHGAAEGLSDEEAEFQGRFVGDKSQNGKKGVFEEEDERASTKDSHHQFNDDFEDEEDKLFEEEQFKKGLGRRMDIGSNKMASADNSSVVQQQKFMYPSTSVAPTSIGGAVGFANGLDTMSLSKQAELAKKALLENTGRLKDTHVRTKSSLAKTDENLCASLLNIDALEKSLSAASEKYIFMQKLQDYISVISDLLQEKGPYIEGFEEEIKDLNRSRATAILERRAADNDDEMMEIEVAVKAALNVFREHGNSNAMVAAATSAALAASTSVREKTRAVKLDELGRDLNRQKRMDMERRAAARQRRKARYDSKRFSAMQIDNSNHKTEGESSTDESDGDSDIYKGNRTKCLEDAEKIFSDTSEEYSLLSAVKEKFERWKQDYSSSYRDAYMSLSVPAIFSPYVRLELLKWDPLHEETDFLDMKWHMLLFNYGQPEDESDFAPDDADVNLIPELVEKVAVPLLHHEIAHCWDMLSTRKTRNAVHATSLVINYVPASRMALTELLNTIRTRLGEAVASLMVPTWSPLLLKAVPNAAKVAAYRFGMSIRLMRNICLWKDILSMPVLEKLALDDLLFGKILPHVRSIESNVHDAVTRTERIVASLSGVWTGPSVAIVHSRKLQPLVDYVSAVGRNLERRRASGVSETEVGGLARRLKKLFVDLNDYDKAREIAKTFNLKEAI